MMMMMMSRRRQSAFGLIRSLCGEAERVNRRGRENELYRSLSALGATGGSVSGTLNEYIREEGRVPRKYALDRCIQELRKYRHHHNALQVMDWMDMRDINYNKGDYAIRLDLISKTKGTAAAENYFHALPSSSKNKFTYGALLNCYCVEKMEDKALALFQELEENNLVLASLPYNNLMSLYMRMGHPEKVPVFIQKMKDKNIPLSTHSYNVWMNSLASSNDIEGVERVFDEMTTDMKEKCDWTPYSNLAAVYVKAGLHEKAELTLKKLEQYMGTHNREVFHFLITLYAGTSNLDKVHQIWKHLKATMKTTTNMSYLVMIQTLARLNDVYGLKTLFEEWESCCSTYDTRLTTAAVTCYLKNNMVNEAETVVDNAVKRSSGPFHMVWESFMIYYLDNGQMSLALKSLEAATIKFNNYEWRPSPENIRKFMKYYEKERDVEGAEKLFKILKKINCVDRKAYELLLQTYVAADETEPGMRQRIERDGVEINCELQSLLDRVCPEYMIATHVIQQT